MLTSKVCIVGEYAVGKTSLSERFVNQHFSEEYLTTVGVRIDTKIVEAPPLRAPQKLVIWDVAGTDRFGATEFAYLRGAAGYVFVADGTRPETLETALGLNDQIEEQYGRQARVLLLNKKDMDAQWGLTPTAIEDAGGKFDAVFLTSAKTGDEVEAAFECVAERIASRELEAL
jgi:small GTP-binding protein